MTAYGLMDSEEGTLVLDQITLAFPIFIIHTIMPSVRCPRCIKRFKDQATLLKHMNQPISSCLTHFQELLNIADTLQTKAAQPTDGRSQLGEELLYFMDTTEDPFSAPPADSVHSSFSPSEAPPARNT